MSGRVEGTAAERARGATGDDNLGASAGEGTCLSRLEHDTQDGLELTGALGLECGLALLVDPDLFLSVMAFQDDDAAIVIPSDAHRADPELVLDGCVQRCDVLDGLAHRVRRLAPGEVVKQVIEPVGERAHLLLLQRHGGQPRPGPGLKEEGPLPGRPDCARNEPVWGCLLYTSDAADDLLCVDLGGR